MMYEQVMMRNKWYKSFTNECKCKLELSIHSTIAKIENPQKWTLINRINGKSEFTLNSTSFMMWFQSGFTFQLYYEFYSTFVIQESLWTSWMNISPLCAHEIIIMTMHILWSSMLQKQNFIRYQFESNC